jgi:hypothetical protein
MANGNSSPSIQHLLQCECLLVDYLSPLAVSSTAEIVFTFLRGVAEPDGRGVEIVHTAGWMATPSDALFSAFLLLAAHLVQIPGLHGYLSFF